MPQYGDALALAAFTGVLMFFVGKLLGHEEGLRPALHLPPGGYDIKAVLWGGPHASVPTWGVVLYAHHQKDWEYRIAALPHEAFSSPPEVGDVLRVDGKLVQCYQLHKRRDDSKEEVKAWAVR